MTPLTLTITRAGMERFTAAQLDDDIDLTIAALALTAATFVPAPTLTALPGEFRRLTAVSGDQVGDSIVHMTIRDDVEVGYTVRGFGVFLADGTLFASYGQAEVLFQKSPRATFMTALDIAFPTGDVSQLTFGDTNFLNPPATTARQGVVRLATDAEADAGADAVAVTARQLARVATTDRRGVVELATDAEADAGTDVVAVTGRQLARLAGALRSELAAVAGTLLAKIAEVSAALRAEFAASIGQGAPIGAITLWYGSEASVPAGWAICDGRTVARSDGTGNIATPDMRGRAPVGFTGGFTIGETFGQRLHTIDTTQSGAHAHAVALTGETDLKATGAFLTVQTNTSTAGGGTGTSVRSVDLTDPTHKHAVTVSGQVDGAGAHTHQVSVDVAQPSIVLLFIMRI